MTSQNHRGEPLGGGAYGTVYKALRRDRHVAVKYLHRNVHDDVQRKLEEWKRECEAMRRLKHKNIVKLLGEFIKTVDQWKEFAIIMEYCDRGTLTKLLKDTTIIYTMKTVVYWAVQLFKALRCLHYMKVVHRDIRPCNILVKSVPTRTRSAPYTLKLADLGLVKQIERTCGATMGTSTRYAPFAQRAKDLDTHRNDVYSLGLILWEIIERREVFNDYNYPNGEFCRDDFIVAITEKKLLQLEPPNCQQMIQELIVRCVDFNYSARPRAKECLESLKAIRRDLDFITSMELLPKEEKGLKELLRPIGFDVKNKNERRKRVAVRTLKDPSKAEVERFSSFIESLSRNCFMSDLLVKEAASYIVQKFNDLLESKRLILIAVFLRQITLRRAYCSYKYLEKENIKAEWKKTFDNLMMTLKEKDIQELIEAFILYDIWVLIEQVSSAFRFLNQNGRESLSQKDHQELQKHISSMEEFRRSRITTPIYFRCYFQTSTFHEWLLLDESSNCFVRKDLSEVRVFHGKWVDRRRSREPSFLCETVIQQTIHMFSDHDELHYSHFESLHPHTMIQALNRTFDHQ